MAKKHSNSQQYQVAARGEFKQALERRLYGSQGAAGPAVSRVTGEVLQAAQGPPRPKDCRQPALKPGRVYLTVPFSEGARVRALGARWDPGIRLWWISATTDRAPFAEWQPFP
jgi:hypothetical protein